MDGPLHKADTDPGAGTLAFTITNYVLDSKELDVWQTKPADDLATVNNLLLTLRWLWKGWLQAVHMISTVTVVTE